MKTASRLRAAGCAGAFDLSPKALVFEALRSAEEGRVDLFHSAVAAGIGANGDKAAWKAITP